MKSITNPKAPGRPSLRAAFVCLAVVLLLVTPRHTPGFEPVRHVIMITIDGLVSEYYLPDGRAEDMCPTLARMRNEGTVVRRALPPYPSQTYPGHATLVTGVNPDRHGIIGNGLYEPSAEVHRGAWFARDLQAPALWDVTHAADMTVGAVFWPVSAKARGIQWNLPEFWTSHYGSEISLVRRYARPGNLLIELEDQLDRRLFHHLQPSDRRDALASIAGLDIFKRYQPNLMLIHFVDTDKIQHRRGRGSPEADEVFSVADGYIAAMWDLIYDEGLEDETVLLVVGDHGFSNIDRSVGPNVELVRAGLIDLDEDRDVVRWDAMVHNSGNSAAVHLADGIDASTREHVRAVLEDFAVDSEGVRRYSFVDADRLRELGAPTDAAYFLEGAAGVMFTGSVHPSFRDRRSSLRGNHGGLSDCPDMSTGMLVVGPGIPAGLEIDQIHLMDVAPTIARLLGLDFPDTTGRAIEELFK